MLRKHFNSMSLTELENLKFYSWQCLSLQTWGRDVDLVIKDDKKMNCFLKFMIYSLRTIDGMRGTAEGILKSLNRQSEREYRTSHKKTYISECMMLSIKTTNEHRVFRKVYLKYLIMRVRAKIGFMALVKRITIAELFLKAI